MRRIPVFWLSCAFIAGVAFGAVQPTGFQVGLIAVFISGSLAFLEYFLGRKCKKYKEISDKLPLPMFVLVTVFTLGVLRYSAASSPPTSADLAYYNHKGRVSLDGNICEDPRHKENSTQIVVCAEYLSLEMENDVPVRGKALVRIPRAVWHYGDRVKITGVLTIAPEDESFSYRTYLATRQIHSLMEYPYVQKIGSGNDGWLKSGLIELRGRGYQKINEYLPQPHAALLSGILLGMEDDIPDELERAFQSTGTAHIIAISGFNMTLLAGLVVSAFRRRLPYWLAGFFAILVIALYCELVGAAPPVVRAALMSCLAMCAQLIGRKQAGPYALIFSVAVLSAVNPLYLWDAGFQLSVGATLGLVLYADRLKVWFVNTARSWFSEGVVRTISGPVAEYFLFTLAAQAVTLPIILFQFERFSVSAILCNPLILPVQPLIMLTGGLAAAIGTLINPLGQILAYFSWVLLSLTIFWVELFAKIPFGVISVGKIHPIFVFAFYISLFLFLEKKRNLPVFQRLRQPAVVLFGLLAATALIWNAALMRTNGKLRIVVFDPPNQGVLLIQSPSGKRVLINGGEHANALSADLNRYLPVIDRHLDVMILLQPRSDLIKAFPVLLQRFPTERFLWVTGGTQNKTARQIGEILLEEQIQSQTLEIGTSIDLGDGVSLTPIGRNEEDAVLLLEYQELRVLFSADQDREWDPRWPLAGALVVLAPGSVDIQYWEEMGVQAVIHHNAGQNRGIDTFEHGFIQLWSDGDLLWINAEK